MLQIWRINNNNSSSDCSSTSSKSLSSTFDAFSEQCSTSREANQMRWLSRPNLRLVRERHSSNLADLERFRISLDVTGFRQEKIKISIEDRVLTISGVLEDGSRESCSSNEKQFEKHYKLPANVDLHSMASYVNNQQKRLIVEIPLIQSQKQMKKLSNGTEQRRVSFVIDKPDEQWEQNQQKSLLTSTKTSSTQGSISNNVTIEIPTELLQSGKTLMIEKHLDLVVDGHHVAQPPHPIRQSHGLCLVDMQRQDQRWDTINCQLQDMINDCELVLIKIEVPPETLQSGKTITIQKNSTSIGSNQQQQPSGNFDDLYMSQYSTGSVGANNIHIEIPEQLIEKGETILIQKDNVSVTKTHDFYKEQAEHMASHQFNKWDHLQSKNMMEVTIQVPPELLNSQAITLRREDLESVATDYHDHRTFDINQRQLSKGDNWRSGEMISMQEFMSNKMWNPSVSECGRLLQMRLEFTCQPAIKRGDQLNLTLNGYDLRIETTDQQGCSAYRQVTLPKKAQLAELKCQFDEERRCLNISVPLH